MKLPPTPNELPPDDAEYQLIVPPLQPVAVNTTVPVPHLFLLVAVGAAGFVPIIAFTVVLVDTQEPTVQPV